MNAEKFKFRTEVSIGKFPFLITLKSKVLLAGSCFADMIGQKLIANKFDALSNPYGNIYNPHSLFSLLKNSLTGQLPEDETYIQNQGRWVNYHFHSEIVSNEKEELKSIISSINQDVGGYLKNADFLVLTLGTAFVYRFLANDSIVANCHKVPAQFFKKQLLSPKEIIDDFDQLHKELLQIRPDIKILFTVSPVRHVKDTLSLNSLSKSILRTSIHYIVESFSNTFYFPSFEIMMDDLRDYRFYKEDLIHPTEMAEEYIWERFCNSCFDNETLLFMQEWQKVSRALNHKAFHPQSEQHQRFLKDTYLQLEALNKKADFTKELSALKGRMVDKL